MTKVVFRLSHPEARRRAAQHCMEAAEGLMVTFAEPTRNLDQNAAMWPILEAFAQQLDWPVNGRMVKLDAEAWKDLLTAAFERESVRLAMALDGSGVVMLGRRTSQYGKRKFSEFLEFLHATAADRGVVVYADERQAA
jgi:hypothetical protein